MTKIEFDGFTYLMRSVTTYHYGILVLGLPIIAMWLLISYISNHYVPYNRTFYDFILYAVIPQVFRIELIPLPVVIESAIIGLSYLHYSVIKGWINQPERRQYAYLRRTGQPLYPDSSSDASEREKRRVFLKQMMSFFITEEFNFSTHLQKHQPDAEFSSQIFAEFSDAKELIGRELAALDNRPEEKSVQLEFINIDGSAIIEYEGSAVRSIELDIRDEGEYDLYLGEGDQYNKFMTALGKTVTMVPLTPPATSGEIRIKPKFGLSERIPLP